MLTIVDYGTGNLRSIANMLGRLGHSSVISSSVEDALSATHLILPGVGHFDYGMSSLRESGLLEALNHKVLVENVPLLGICLGAQLLTRRSDEGIEKGLGWIDGETVRFDKARLKSNCRIPHMGWSETELKADEPLFRKMVDNPRFYYVHSFHMRCDNSENEICHAEYGYKFVAGVRSNNIFGVQFHPEKSHRFGMQILDNFASLSRNGVWA